jgi:hypothetical protein
MDISVRRLAFLLIRSCFNFFKLLSGCFLPIWRG